jgi:hypothetical protein
MLALSLLAVSTAAGQGAKPRKKAPPTRPRVVAPAPEPTLTPREALDRARAATAQPERIDLLEKFLKTYGGDALEAEARQ